MPTNNSNQDKDFEDNVQALPVSSLKKGLDLSKPPTTGEEYLLRVRLEASQLPVVCVANLVANPAKVAQNEPNLFFVIS